MLSTVVKDNEEIKVEKKNINILLNFITFQI